VGHITHTCTQHSPSSVSPSIHRILPLDDRSSYVILNMFFSHFQKVLAAKRMSIRSISYDFRSVVMFSIFESVILIFSKYSNFRGFLNQLTKKSCKSANQEHMKNCQDWEDQEWRFKRPQETLHREEFCSQIPRQVIWRQRPKNDENRRNWAQEATTVRLGHGKKLPCTLGILHMPWASTKLH